MSEFSESIKESLQQAIDFENGIENGCRRRIIMEREPIKVLAIKDGYMEDCNGNDNISHQFCTEGTEYNIIQTDEESFCIIDDEEDIIGLILMIWNGLNLFMKKIKEN
jgi:hypothetical protein